MAKLNIYYFKWDNFYGKAIRFATGDEWSHIGIGYENAKGEHIIYEALNKGFIKSTYGKSLNKNKFCKIQRLNIKATKSKITRVLNKYLGSGYDWLSIFNILNILIFKKSLIKITGAKHLICSEAVARVLADLDVINLSKRLEKEFDFITPQEVYDLMKNVGTN